MNFLFIYGAPGFIGGIETLMVRMSKWLINNGHNVTILTKFNEGWKDLLEKGVSCFALGNRFRELNYFHLSRRLIRNLQIRNIDLIKSFDISSSLIAYQLAKIYGNQCKAIAGYYNPLIKSYPNKPKFWHGDFLAFYAYLMAFNKNSRLLCGLDQKEELEEIYSRSGIIWPIPCDENEFIPAERKPKWGKIVSIGRLDGMKEYNLYMIKIIRDLRNQGLNVSWTVYGEGIYKKEMVRYINEYGLEGVVYLKGTIPYRMCRRVLEDAYIFIGMGTSAIEAALFKVPNIMAIPYDTEGLTYGPNYTLPMGSIGHSTKFRPKLKIIDEIKRILFLSKMEYEKEAELAAQHARIHEINSSMCMFINLIKEAEPNNPIRIEFMNYPLGILRQILKRFKILRFFSDVVALNKILNY